MKPPRAQDFTVGRGTDAPRLKTAEVPCAGTGIGKASQDSSPFADGTQLLGSPAAAPGLPLAMRTPH